MTKIFIFHTDLISPMMKFDILQIFTFCDFWSFATFDILRLLTLCEFYLFRIWTIICINYWLLYFNILSTVTKSCKTDSINTWIKISGARNPTRLSDCLIREFIILLRDFMIYTHCGVGIITRDNSSVLLLYLMEGWIIEASIGVKAVCFIHS